MSPQHNFHVTIIDSGLGNIASVANIVRKIGGNPIISRDRKTILSASKLILPGVGAFDHGIEQLHRLDFFSPIKDCCGNGTPLLGICLGMQLLANKSEEGSAQGLGLVDAEFKKFSFDPQLPLRVPHVGWNKVNIVKSNPLFSNDELNDRRFYFTHSYHAVCNDKESILATTSYGIDFTSIYYKDNVYGVQFHPEKSHKFGMAMMKKFLEI
jgi:imidazole glycerol-phosphate synthase subunit HisH